jgi:hypothetical protein
MDSVTLANPEQKSQAPADQMNTKCSLFQINAAMDGLPNRVPPPLFGASFAFVVNGAMIESDVAEAAELSPFVREQLSVDACAYKFVICDSVLGSSAIASLESLLSGSAISVGRSEVLLSGHFGNAALESHFLFCSKAGFEATLSVSVIEKRVVLESEDLSILSFEALDDLLLNCSVMIESEDSLLKLFLNRG